jgi:pilus assembly protein CpaC
MKKFWISLAFMLLCSVPQISFAKPLIQIGVEVVEVDEQKTLNLGVDWMEKLGLQELNVPAILKVGTVTRDALFADLDAMLDHGTANLLANPKLVTRDGSTANFHAGGELPYATSGSLGTVQVEFKPYGVTLKISPHLEINGEITLNLDAEVSGPDDQHTVILSGNTVQGIRTRQISSQLTLTPGNTLTLAGLIQNDKVDHKKGIPGLMEIPILGRLFYVNTKADERTSIVVFVTPMILEGDHADAPITEHAE